MRQALASRFFKENNQIKCDGTSVMHIPSWCFANQHNWCLLFMLSLSSWSIKLLRLEIGIFRELKKLQNANLSHVSFFLILTCALKHVVCLGESRLSEVNNSPRANVFPAGVANFGKAMYQSQERPTKDTRDGFFCTVPRPHFLGRALIWSGYFGEHILGLFGLHPSSLSKLVA